MVLPVNISKCCKCVAQTQTSHSHIETTAVRMYNTLTTRYREAVDIIETTLYTNSYQYHQSSSRVLPGTIQYIHSTYDNFRLSLRLGSNTCNQKVLNWEIKFYSYHDTNAWINLEKDRIFIYIFWGAAKRAGSSASWRIFSKRCRRIYIFTSEIKFHVNFALWIQNCLSNFFLKMSKVGSKCLTIFTNIFTNSKHFCHWEWSKMEIHFFYIRLWIL